jgi:TolB protein
LTDEAGIWDLIVLDLTTNESQVISQGNNVDAMNHSWSPEGLRIAYQSTRNGNLDVYSYDLNDGTEYFLTDYDGSDSSPTWNCGGSMISFTTVRDGNPDIYQVSWMGGGQSYLTNHPATDKWSEWSPSKEQGSRGK